MNVQQQQPEPANTCSQSCPLCAAQDRQHAPYIWHTEQRKPLTGRVHLRCPNCALVFVPSAYHLSAAAEKAYYDLHENNGGDAGYRKFLSRAAEPILRLMPAGSHGLDFGSGPGPTLSLMLNEAGIQCADYDLYYAHHPELLQRQYDFITSTEVFEHLAKPRATLDELVPLLNSSGLLVIMTQRPRDVSAFAQWQYILDPTHITFFSEQSFAYIAKHWQLELLELHQDVVVFRKPLI
jgi:hypothetical protein